MKQPRVIKCLAELAGANAYLVSARKKDKSHEGIEKLFLPDLIAIPYKGKGDRVFEVEATVVNNTVSKSLISLLSYFAKHPHSFGYLVVPAKHKPFADKSWAHLKTVLKSFGGKVRDSESKPQLTVLTFQDVKSDYDKYSTWFKNGRIGQPTKCKCFPRPR